MPDASSDACPKCGEPLISGKMYCPNCGLAVLFAPERVAVDAYVEARVRQAVDARMADKDSLSRAIADDAEDILWKRVKHYSWIIGVAGLLLGVWGLHSLADAKNTIVNEAHNRLDPVISDTEKRVKSAQGEIGQTNQEIGVVKTQLDGTSKLAQEQSDRISGQAGEINTKLQQIQSAYTRANELSSAYEKQAADLQQKLTQFQANAEAQNRRMEEAQKTLDVKMDAVIKRVDRVSMQQAYPTLGQKMYVTYNGHPWKGTGGKKASDKWVNINLDPIAVGENRVTSADLAKFSDELEKRGYTPIPGSFGVGGSVGTGYGCFQGYLDGVYYFDPKYQSDAAEVSKLATEILNLPMHVTAAKIAGGASVDPLRFVMEHAGVDLQVCVARAY